MGNTGKYFLCFKYTFGHSVITILFKDIVIRYFQITGDDNSVGRNL